MRLSGYQPQFFPRLHYFVRMLNSDIFEISDYVQFVKKHAYATPEGKQKRGKSYQADAPIKLGSGIHFLTVPTQRLGLLPTNQTKIAYETPWAEKQLKTIEVAYSKSKNFKVIFPELTELLTTKYENLAALNIKTILWALARIIKENKVNLKKITLGQVNELLNQSHPFQLKKVVLISETDIRPPDKTKEATDWIIEMCQKFGANQYYFGGTSAAAYMDFEKFKKAKIRTVKQEWICPSYWQQYPKVGFIPNLSIIDLLFNEETERVNQILKGN